MVLPARSSCQDVSEGGRRGSLPGGASCLRDGGVWGIFLLSTKIAVCKVEVSVHQFHLPVLSSIYLLTTTADLRNLHVSPNGTERKV